MQAVNLLQRARNLGIDPNTIMYNTAISALGKSYRWEAAEQLFHMIPNPDTISYETMIAAYGLAGQIEKAETFFNAMLDAGHVPRDYAFCGLIAAYRSVSPNPLAAQPAQMLHSHAEFMISGAFNAASSVIG